MTSPGKARYQARKEYRRAKNAVKADRNKATRDRVYKARKALTAIEKGGN